MTGTTVESWASCVIAERRLQSSYLNFSERRELALIFSSIVCGMCDLVYWLQRWFSFRTVCGQGRIQDNDQGHPESLCTQFSLYRSWLGLNPFACQTILIVSWSYGSLLGRDLLRNWIIDTMHGTDTPIMHASSLFVPRWNIDYLLLQYSFW